MRLSTIALVVLMITGIAILCGLGSWQVKRLYWKEDLIAKVEERTSLAAQPIDAFLNGGIEKTNWPYHPIAVEGVFDHSKEVYFFTTSIKGRSGWNVHTPLLLDNGNYLIVNRGFVPYDLRDPELRLQGQVTEKQSITGLVRVPETTKPNAWFPENNPQNRELYWRDLNAFENLMGKEEGREFVPFFVDANDEPIPGSWPKGGTTIIAFSNSHLQYAVTWYGLALALLGVGGYFLYSRRQKNND